MELGLALPQFGAWSDPSRIAEFARETEAMGFDSLWVGDRLLTPTDPSDLYPAEPKPYPPEFTNSADPLITWAAAAAATTRIRLGSSTLNAPWYNAVVLARALTTIDALSRGRLDVGFGLSWMRDEYTAARVDWATRARRLDETLDLLQAWWTTNPVEFHGEFFDVPESVVDLRPTQPGGPPVYLGGFTPAAMERVGRRAHGYLAVSGAPADYQAHLWDVARTAAQSAGRDPDGLRRILRVNPYDGAVDKLEAEVETARAAGYHGTFFDLSYCTGSIDDALEVARTLLSRVRT